MLILTRRPGERIIIGDNISLVVLAIKGNQIRLGIEAPESVPVHREELFERIQKNDLLKDDQYLEEDAE